jgi:hypothetical protein
MQDLTQLDADELGESPAEDKGEQPHCIHTCLGHCAAQTTGSLLALFLCMFTIVDVEHLAALVAFLSANMTCFAHQKSLEL